jgi:hypothetical protein
VKVLWGRFTWEGYVATGAFGSRRISSTYSVVHPTNTPQPPDRKRFAEDCLVQNSTLFLHAVFISGLPNLPCLPAQPYLSHLQRTTMSIDINHLALQPLRPIWHPTCNRNVRHCRGRCRSSRPSVASAPAGFSETAGFLYPLSGDAIRFSSTPRRAGVEQQAEPKCSPQLGGSHHE